MKTLVTIVVIVVVAVGMTFLLSSAARERAKEMVGGPPSLPSDDEFRRPSATDPRQVNALGWIEPAGGVVQVAAMTGERLASLNVKKGDMVEQGQVLGMLDSHTLRKLEHGSLVAQRDEVGRRRDAEKTVATARVRAAKIGVERAKELASESSAKEREIEVLVAARESAIKDLSRLEALSLDLASRQDRERQALAVKKSEAELAAAQAGKERLAQANRLNLAAAQADLASAEAAAAQIDAVYGVESIEKKLELSKAQLDRSEIVAPAGGTVLEVTPRVGEMIDTRPILQIADLSKMDVLAEVHETEIKRLSMGQRVEVRSPAFPAPYDRTGLVAEITDIGRMIGAPHLKAVDPFVRSDRHVVRVRCRFDAKSTPVAAQLVNLQVDVQFVPPPDVSNPDAYNARAAGK